MVAFVLGATGFVGREVVRQLAVRGAKVVAHVRPQSADRWRAHFEAQGVAVDTTAWDAVALAARIRELAPAQIYILIGTTRSAAKRDAPHAERSWGTTGDIYEKIDLGLTKLAALAARASETSPRIVYLSSVGADRSARSAYLAARGKAEDVVMSSGLPWAIARPAIITGERDEARLGERAASVVGDGLLAIAGVFGGRRLRDKYRSTTPDVLASALIRIGEDVMHDRIAEGSDLR